MADFYTVSQINGYIKGMFERDFVLKRIRVKGEVSNCKYHGSGHIYFTLKDSGAQINCVMFRTSRDGLTFIMKDGQQIEATGHISVYEKGGSYQLYVRTAALSGAGELYEKYLELKNKLEDMGMFDPLYKKPIPAYCMRIGIVTAPTGAAVQDIINISSRRNPYAKLILYPALVQGTGAKESIIKGIRRLDEMGLDVIIIGRGGGSIEDLWAFNEEEVAEAIFEAKTPIISAVGHETDFTIADFVSDMRAPTPSAAAELANFEYADFEEQLSAALSALRANLENKKSITVHRLSAYEERLKRLSPQIVLSHKKDRLSEIKLRLYRAAVQKKDHEKERLSIIKTDLSECIDRKLSDRKHELKLSISRLDGASPLKKMSGGYGYLMNSEKKAVRSVLDVTEGDIISAYVADGKIECRALSAEEINYGR